MKGPKGPRCASCNRRPRIGGEKFCIGCRSWKMRQMEQDRYLTPLLEAERRFPDRRSTYKQQED